MAINGGAHKFNKNVNNWLQKHFEPQQVDVVVSSMSILGLESLSAFPPTDTLKGSLDAKRMLGILYLCICVKFPSVLE